MLLAPPPVGSWPVASIHRVVPPRVLPESPEDLDATIYSPPSENRSRPQLSPICTSPPRGRKVFQKLRSDEQPQVVHQGCCPPPIRAKPTGDGIEVNSKGTKDFFLGHSPPFTLSSNQENCTVTMLSYSKERATSAGFSYLPHVELRPSRQ